MFLDYPAKKLRGCSKELEKHAAVDELL